MCFVLWRLRKILWSRSHIYDCSSSYIKYESLAPKLFDFPFSSVGIYISEIAKFMFLIFPATLLARNRFRTKVKRITQMLVYMFEVQRVSQILRWSNSETTWCELWLRNIWINNESKSTLNHIFNYDHLEGVDNPMLIYKSRDTIKKREKKNAAPLVNKFSAYPRMRTASSMRRVVSVICLSVTKNV